MILSFRTDRSEQTVLTQMEQSGSTPVAIPSALLYGKSILPSSKILE